MNGFNNGYYNAYQPVYQNRMGLDWVNGIEGAKAYQLVTGSPMLLLDSGDSSRFYIKSNDNLGMPQPIRIFEYKEIKPEVTESTKEQEVIPNYATKEDIDKLEKMISDLKKTNYKDKK